MRAMRGVTVVSTVVSTVLAALLLSASPAAAAPTATIQVRGLEYAATLVEGRFGGAAQGPLPGAWRAVVRHDPLRQGEAVPVTGGSFTLYGARRVLDGTFTRGRVTPHDTPATCGDERFDVTGTLALQGGGRGAFAVVLTHLRVLGRSGCTTYGATVVGTLNVPAEITPT
jgi:hypothetical protein